MSGARCSVCRAHCGVCCVYVLCMLLFLLCMLLSHSLHRPLAVLRALVPKVVFRAVVLNCPFAIILRSSCHQFCAMGSYGDTWLQCTWCGWWGKCMSDMPDHLQLTDIDSIPPMLLCNRCFDLEEPPWWPNNRQRCAASLPLALPGTDRIIEIQSTIAKFVAENTA